ncbi:hypothetical protein HK413_11920 [Mucilaginibacter sp. S1162]|uniref:Uncharacterized protein n=1 Tax=Mucilaginibacter humi TaxID=2732510 RepID=A0ABX1W6G2_9SPHI|nr:hypothetical protein [Mucilaginibacter humi]NNU34610.1 hypothetical protein [Mucilaginibacter humi]
MKKVALISAIALSGLFYSNANAQLLQIGLHLGGGRPVVEALVTPSVAVSYSNADQYYYMPEVDAYYSPYERVYYYNEGGRWVSNAYFTRRVPQLRLENRPSLSARTPPIFKRRCISRKIQRLCT